MEDLVDLGPLPEFQQGGACFQNVNAQRDLYPPRIVGGRALSLDEHDDAVARGIQTWCGACPIMVQCGEKAAEMGYSGPFGGRIFWEGKEVGMAEKHSRRMPVSSRRMYTENLSKHEQADRNHCHELLAKGVSQHVWREQESWLGVWFGALVVLFYFAVLLGMIRL